MIYKTNSVRIKLEFVDLIKQGNCQEKYSLKGWFYSLKQLSPRLPRSVLYESTLSEYMLSSSAVLSQTKYVHFWRHQEA